MDRNEIESDFRTSKMAADSYFVKNKKKIKKYLYWSKMARNVIQNEFRISKMANGSYFVKNFKKNVAYRSEMARNEIKSDFRTSKLKKNICIDGQKCDPNWISDIQNGRRQPFCKNKFRIDLKWPEMRPKVIFGYPKWPPAAIL